MNFLTAMFSEPGGGGPSSTRALTAIVVLVVIGVWASVSLRKMELQPMSGEMVAIVALSLGLKVWQRGKENGHGTKSGDTAPPFTTK